MITLSNGHAFEYMTASGALSYDGKGWPWEQPWRWIGQLDSSLFTSVTKTLTLKEKKGKSRWYKCVRFIPNGIVNAVGLSNPGIDWWCEGIGPTVDSKKIPLIVSVYGELDELAIMARMLNDFDLVGLEINVSCPNVEKQETAKIIASCEVVRANSRFPLILKLSVTHDVKQIAIGIDNLIEAISINSVPWATIFPHHQSPLKKFGGGGVSGKAAQSFTWGLTKKLTDLTSIPIIGPSIWDFGDLEIVRKCGAKAVSFGSVFMLHPGWPTQYVREEQKRKY